MLYQDAPPTDAPTFKTWFGDSKVVDDAGRPLTLWHQTGADIEAFDPRRPGAGQFHKVCVAHFVNPSFWRNLTAQFCVARIGTVGRGGWCYLVGRFTRGLTFLKASSANL